MRLFSADSLRVAASLSEKTDPVKAKLRDVGALTEGLPDILGLYLNLDSDYRALLDLRVSPEVSLRLFFRLLDSRLSLELIRASLVLAGLSYPADASKVRIDPSGLESEAALERIGGRDGAKILETAEKAENELLDVLDILTADERDVPAGHHKMYFLPALSGAHVAVQGAPIATHLLVMLDDGHMLDSSQRYGLLDQLRGRHLQMERWYAERTEALEPDDLLGAGVPSRDYEEVVLEDAFQRGSVRFRNMVAEIANRRASSVLGRVTDVTARFTDLIETETDSVLNGREAELLGDAVRTVRELAAGELRYREWAESLEDKRGRDGLARLLELEVLINRDKSRVQGELFEEVLKPGDVGDRGSSALREAALLRFAIKRRLPYYSGLDLLMRLGSTNVEQVLTLCGDLFAEILLSVSVGRDPHVDAVKQNRVLRDASDSYYNSVATGIPNGHLVQTLIDGIDRLAKAEASKPNIPYPPGVTGTALSVRDVAVLMDPDRRRLVAGANLLHTALGSAVAYNVVSLEKDYRVKGSRYTVIYLNRLLCPRYGMPMGYGAFRERSLPEMASWFAEGPSSDGSGRLL